MILPRHVALAVALVALCASAATASQGVELIRSGSLWRYLDDGSVPDPAWIQPAFDASAWTQGPARLGYGVGDEATVIDFGGNPDDKHIATYFRREFQVANPAAHTHLGLRLLREDGGVIYLNGVEVGRMNLPVAAGPDTPASGEMVGAAEFSFAWAALPTELLVPGKNVLCVRLHQAAANGPDIGFDAQLLGHDRPFVTRGPYVQRTSSDRVVIHWRTLVPIVPELRYGPSPGVLNRRLLGTGNDLDHVFELRNLAPNRTYFYSVGTTTQTLAGGDPQHRFTTAPLKGSEDPIRIWVLGDSGEANDGARRVRDAYSDFGGIELTDLVLMLGDNAYDFGTQLQHQGAVFDMYPEYLRRIPFWPTRGNHEALIGVYEDVFDLPAAGEVGGEPSGTESYYAFDWGNIHFLCLDSTGSDRAVGGAMWSWAQADLQNNDAEWLIAFWHHPPYSAGSHDSDTELPLVEMRENFLPLLEDHGVDLVLAGHSHSLERSALLDGHYGFSTDLQPGMLLDPGNGNPSSDGAYVKVDAARQGAVYAVAGSSCKLSSNVPPLDHPVMVSNLLELGSLVIDVEGPRLTARFLNDSGQVLDEFELLSFEDDTLLPNTLEISRSTGGTQTLTLSGGQPLAGALYVLAGSTNGTEPATPIDQVEVPLVIDNYTLLTLTPPAYLSGFQGLLDATGSATAAIQLPTAFPPSLVGLELHHAWLGFPISSVPQATFASSPVPLRLVP